MVDKKVISKSIDDAIFKCGPTIKQRFESFNSKDFKSEKYSRKDGQIKEEYPSPVGRIQQLQEDLQNDIEYDNVDKSVLWEYQGSGFLDYSAWFYHTSKWFTPVADYILEKWKEIAKNNPDSMYANRLKSYEESLEYWKYQVYNYHVTDDKFILDKPLTFQNYRLIDFTKRDGKTSFDSLTFGSIPFDKSITVIDNIIDKSPPLQENTVLYRNGPFDMNLKPGETGKWKSFTSTSFNSYVARKGLKEDTQGELNWATSPRYQIKIYAPKGTKGVVPYDGNGCEDFQSEFLLSRNQKYIVLNVDKEKKTAEVLLY